MFLAQNYLTRGFWGDEAWTSLISQLPYLQMLKTTAADFHPPAYYSVIELVYKFLPPTEIVTRSISIFFYLLTLFLVYKLASFTSVILNVSEGSRDSSSLASLGPQNDKEESHRKKKIIGLNLFGALSTAVVALNPIFFTYAFEARNYTMFAFAATGSIYSLIKLSVLSSLKGQLSDDGKAVSRSASNTPGVNLDGALHTPGVRKATIASLHTLGLLPWAIGFVMFSTLGIYTHYYMFFTLAAEGLYLLLFDRKIFWRIFVLFVIIGVLYLPWLPFLAGQLKSVGQSYWIGGIDRRTHFEAFLRILGGEHSNAFRPWLFGLSIMLLVVGVVQHALRHHPSTSHSTLRDKPSGSDSKSSGPRFEKPYVLIWLWATVPFVLASLPGLKIAEVSLPFRPIFFWRYLINASVPLAMVMVHTAQKFGQWGFGLVMGTLVILSLFADVLSFQRYPYTFRQVYQQKVLPDIHNGDKLITVLPSFAEVLYYRNRFDLENELIVLPEGIVTFSGKSLLDAYVENGAVIIADKPTSGFFELRPGPVVRRVE